MFLKAIAPLLGANSEVSLLIKPAAGGMSVLVQPTLAGMQPDTDDERLADLQAALSMPFVVTIPSGADPDAAMATALRSAVDARAPVIDALTSYREQMADASNRDRIAREQSAAKKPAGKRDGAAAEKKVSGVAPPVGGTEGEDAAATTAAPAQSEPAAEPVSTLFDA